MNPATAAPLRPSRRTVLLGGLGVAASVPLVGLSPAQAESAVTISDLVLQVGSDETSRSLSWLCTEDAEEYVQYAEAADLVDDVFPSSAVSVAATRGAANTSGEYYQHATVSNLSADTDYVYRVGSDSAGWSETYSFSTAPVSSSFSFFFVGDPQIGASGDASSDGEGWAATMALAESEYPDAQFVLTGGDQVETAASEEQYSYFLAPEQLTTIPLATALGNHDYGSLAYQQHFNMPNVSDGYGAASSESQSGGNAWFRYQHTLFITLNTNNSDTDEHIEYVRQIMADQSDATWTVVNFHHSVFSVASHAFDSQIVTYREVLPPAFSELGVDLVLMGHDHHFTRSYLMNGVDVSAAESAGTVSGTVVPEEGDVLYLTANSSSGSKYYSDNSRISECYWAEVSDQQSHPNFTYVTMAEDTITLETYDTTTNTLVDQVVLAPTSDTDDGDDGGDDSGDDTGDDGGDDTGSGSTTRKLRTKTRMVLSKHRQVRHRRPARAKITVRVPGSTKVPRGRVKVFDGHRLVKVATLRKGHAVVTLPDGLSVGQHRLHAVFVANDRFRRSVSGVSRLKVRRRR
ncbi:MAG: metallophosphoesterase family protein [Nocardioides sp.]|uniref:fibronectin type III domain-containing protein n=1 Tax=Nocardioides sp. TaxID=35761 RepID=UPI0039E4553C